MRVKNPTAKASDTMIASACTTTRALDAGSPSRYEYRYSTPLLVSSKSRRTFRPRCSLLHLHLLVLVGPHVGFIHGRVVSRVSRPIGRKTGVQRGQIKRLTVSPHAADHRPVVARLSHRPAAHGAGDFARN